MVIIDDFEDQNHDEYVAADGSNGDKSWIGFVTSPVYNGTYAMRVGNDGWRNYISHPDNTNLPSYLNHYPIRGDTIQWHAYLTADGDVRLQFGVQDTTTRNNCYSCRVSARNSHIQIRVRSGGSEIQTIGPSSTTVPTLVWIKIEVAWTDDGSGNSAFTVTATNTSDGSEITSFTGTDSTALYTDGGVGLGSVGDAAGDKLWDYIRVTDTASFASVTGTVTVDGTALEGATITGINDTTGSVYGTTTTDANGDYSIDFPVGDTAHLLMEYDDGTNQYNDKSKPFVVVEDTST